MACQSTSTARQPVNHLDVWFQCHSQVYLCLLCHKQSTTRTCGRKNTLSGAGPLIVPLPTVHNPAITRSRLDFPQPDGPITSNDSPGLMAKKKLVYKRTWHTGAHNVSCVPLAILQKCVLLLCVQIFCLQGREQVYVQLPRLAYTVWLLSPVIKGKAT